MTGGGLRRAHPGAAGVPHAPSAPRPRPLPAVATAVAVVPAAGCGAPAGEPRAAGPADLGPDVTIVTNQSGLLGGVRLWDLPEP